MSKLVASELQYSARPITKVEGVAMFDQCFCKSSSTVPQAVHLYLSSSSFNQSNPNHLACDWLRIFACFSIRTRVEPTVQKACGRVEDMAEEALMLLVDRVYAWFLMRPRKGFILYLLLDKLPLDRCSIGASPFMF